MPAEANAPKLLKSRIRHSRLAMLALLPVILFTQPLLPAHSGMRVCMVLLGYALIITCVLGRSYCALFIGGRKNNALIEEGPFAAVRNPLYCFSFLGVLGVGMQSGSLILLAALAGAFALYYPQVVVREEAFLLHKFGDSYRDYMARVPRWWPNFRQWREPEAMESRPGFVRKTMMDAAIFFLPLPLLICIEWLHASGVLPVIIALP